MSDETEKAAEEGLDVTDPSPGEGQEVDIDGALNAAGDRSADDAGKKSQKKKGWEGKIPDEYHDMVRDVAKTAANNAALQAVNQYAESRKAQEADSSSVEDTTQTETQQTSTQPPADHAGQKANERLDHLERRDKMRSSLVQAQKDSKRPLSKENADRVLAYAREETIAAREEGRDERLGLATLQTPEGWFAIAGALNLDLRTPQQRRAAMAALHDGGQLEYNDHGDLVPKGSSINLDDPKDVAELRKKNPVMAAKLMTEKKLRAKGLLS